ncbi:hypothetical protein [Deinococcus sp. QL22]|uniref:hypothetical protein n=1 Tax=Deinococcus sp. QL22 TaxID=2939437 RepID=UPI0020177838|nr:hypothetical protein [Deinococcus sp. QL22]UQN07940.1 hypothetical protein M1R55_17720 [Deinococcus sp. QL22]
MNQSIKDLIQLIVSSDVETRKDYLTKIGEVFTNQISEITGHTIKIFIYFVDARAKSIACTFYCEGSFPFDLYEGVCSVSIEDDLSPSSSCHILPFWQDKRVMVIDGIESYIYAQVALDENYNTYIKNVLWNADSEREWESHTKPRKNLYEHVERIYDDY